MIVHHILWLDNMNEKTLKISPSLLYLDLYVHPSVPFTYIGMVLRAIFLHPLPLSMSHCHCFIKRVNKNRKFWKYTFWYVLVWWFLIHIWSFLYQDPLNNLQSISQSPIVDIYEKENVTSWLYMTHNWVRFG